jgi:hypothetical protein
MNSIVSRIVGILLSIFTIVYFGYQAYMMVYDPYVSETALVDNYMDQIDIQGIAVKSEQLLDDASSGIVNYRNTNSKKVLAGAVVASVYANQEDLEVGQKLTRKQEQMDILQAVQEKHDSYANSAQTIMSDTKASQLELVKAIQNNDYSSVYAAQNDFLEDMLKQQITLDSTVDFSSEIQALSQEIETLKQSLSKEPVDITVPAAGYFTNETDGYETILTPESLENFDEWTPQQLQQYTTQQVTVNPNATGKVIDSTEWYFVAEFDTDYLSRVEEGQTVTLSFSEGNGFQVKADIDTVLPFEDQETSLVLLKSSNMSDEVVDLRVENASMIFSTSKGIKVSKEALRMVSETEETEEGEEATTTTPGVYVDMGQVVRFRKVDVLFEGEDYVVCAVHGDDDSYLQIYDEVILKGDDLYDGKPI